MLIRIRFMLLAALAVAICGPARADEKVSELAQKAAKAQKAGALKKEALKKFEAKVFRSRDGAILDFKRIDNKDIEARRSQDGPTLNYRIHKPDKMAAKEKCPLVLVLHGRGTCGNDNVKQILNPPGPSEILAYAQTNNINAIIIAPQTPKGWGGSTMQMMIDLVKKTIATLPVDTNRIYITGLSLGGYGTWNMISSYPDLFAAAIPICGGGNTKVASRLKHIPIWAFHGDKDNVVPPDRSRSMIAAIKKAGGRPLYTEYKGVGHHCWAQTYANPEVLKWFFDQRKKAGGKMFVHQPLPSFHKQVDANGDGTVSLEELKAHPYFAKNPKKAEKMFKQRDADNSGGLTEAEMARKDK